MKTIVLRKAWKVRKAREQKGMFFIWGDLLRQVWKEEKEKQLSELWIANNKNPENKEISDKFHKVMTRKQACYNWCNELKTA